MVSDQHPKNSFFSLRGSPVLVFRVLIVGIMLSTGIGVIYAISNRPAFVASFPGASAWPVYVGFLVTAGVGLVALLGLWAWRRWGLVLFCIQAVMSFVLDRIAGAPLAHELAVLGGAVAALSLAYINRGRFTSSAGL